MAQGDDAREQMIQVPPRVLVELIATMTAAPPNTGTVKVRSAGPKPPADDFWRARECGTQTRLRRLIIFGACGSAGRKQGCVVRPDWSNRQAIIFFKAQHSKTARFYCKWARSFDIGSQADLNGLFLQIF